MAQTNGRLDAERGGHKIGLLSQFDPELGGGQNRHASVYRLRLQMDGIPERSGRRPSVHREGLRMDDYLDQLIPKVTVPEGVSGDWSVERFEIPDSMVAAFRERLFKAGVYTQLRYRDRLIMSDTPAERLDHADFVRNAKGNVLISGLGLGMCLGAVLRRLEVSSVTVVEKSPDVIRLVAPYFQGDARLIVINADIMTWKPPKDSRYGAVWHDIWSDACADNLPQMATLNRRYARKSDWIGCWSQDLLRRVQTKGHRQWLMNPA